MPTYELDIDGSKYQVEAGSEADLPEIAETISAQNAPEPQGLLGQASSMVGGAFDAVKGAVQGQHDPAFAQAPAFDATQLNKGMFSGDGPQGFDVNAKMTTSNDQEFAEVLATRMNENGMNASIIKDSNGFPLLKYTGPDGKEVTEYVNKPGLDFDDVDRLAAQATIFTPGAVGANALRGGAGLTGRMLAQGGAAGATSLASDAGAAQMGSQTSSTDALADAGLAAAGGAGGELASAALRPAVVWLKSRGLFRGGQLTPEGREVAAKAGLDPEALATEHAKEFAHDVASSGNVEAAARRPAFSENSVPVTRGQLTLDPEDLRIEQEMAAGTFGNRTAQEFSPHFDRKQVGQTFRDVADTRIDDITNFPRTSADDSGSQLLDRVRGDFDAGRADVEEAFSGVSREGLRIRRSGGAAKFVDDSLASEIDGLADDGLDSRKAYNLIQKFAQRKIQTDPITPKGEAKPLSLLDIRDNLVQYADSAAGNSQEYRRVAKLRDAFDMYVDDLAKRGEHGVKAKDIQEYVQAYDMSRALNKKFKSRGKLDMGGKFVEKMLDRGDITPSTLIDEMFGASMKPRQNSLASTKRVLELVGRDSAEADLLRSTVLSRATEGAKGQILPPKTLMENLDGLMQNKAIRELMGERGMFEVRKLRGDIAKLKRPDAPAGKSALSQEAIRGRRDGALQYLMKAKGSGERFSGNPMGATFWHLLARSLPVTAPIAEITGKQVAKKHLGAVLPRSRGTGVGSIAGAASNRGDE